MTEQTPFDAADYLDNETIAEYMSAALEDPNPDVLLSAVCDVARARGMSQLAKDVGTSKPSFHTIVKTFHTLGLRITVSPRR